MLIGVAMQRFLHWRTYFEGKPHDTGQVGILHQKWLNFPIVHVRPSHSC